MQPLPIRFSSIHGLKYACRHHAVLARRIFFVISWFTLAFPAHTFAADIINNIEVVTVSAASYAGGAAGLAPGSIVAAFGTQLATRADGAVSLPLPLRLAGTTVEIMDSKGVRHSAALFFVSEYQVNYLVPENAAVGMAQVLVTSELANGNRALTRGRMRIAAVAPALFSANATGGGAPAAQIGRVNAQGQFVFDAAPAGVWDAGAGAIVPRPVDAGTEKLPAFLILYGTGFRQGADTLRVLIGGVDVAPAYVGAAPGFAGLDQVNVQLPASLRQRGRLDFSLVSGGVASNSLVLDTMENEGVLNVSGFDAPEGVNAGQVVTIHGRGFSPEAGENIVRFGSAQGRVVSSDGEQMQVIVPFGAETCQLMVRTPAAETRSEAWLRVKTSISGLVQSAGGYGLRPHPLANVTIRVVGAGVTARTNAQGVFMLPGMAPGARLLEIDGETTQVAPPFPRVTLKMYVRPDRDNQFTQAISLQQITGPGLEISAGAPADSGTLPYTLTDAGVTLELPAAGNVIYPDDRTAGKVSLTMLRNGRLPGVKLPPGVYANAVAQITPIGAKFQSGAGLRFPNPDPENLAPGAQVDFYRYDTDTGGFIRRGTGTVSADRSRIVADGGVIDQASYWLMIVPGAVTTVTGQVVDELGRPVAGAHVSVNGCGDITDANGGFIIPDVAAMGAPDIQADIVLPMPEGISPRATSTPVPANGDGVTHLGLVRLEIKG
ncbi:MAG: hypothetical protein ACKV2V_13490 [Blastocatellia bacterium]